MLRELIGPLIKSHQKYKKSIEDFLDNQTIISTIDEILDLIRQVITYKKYAVNIRRKKDTEKSIKKHKAKSAKSTFSTNDSFGSGKIKI